MLARAVDKNVVAPTQERRDTPADVDRGTEAHTHTDADASADADANTETEAHASTRADSERG
eukprot:14792215-Alexandrium_andersonii.AAC.1